MGISVEDLVGRSDIAGDSARKVSFLPEPEPRERWATILSVDDHVVEPPDIFEDRFSSLFADDAPRVVETDDGGQAWLWLDRILPNVGFNAVAGRPPA
ncbi:MAG: amidohydrolase, partial [Deltaproteobacteria bacterium]|nr:amidohydrolase [Deltaproteobacteria bacterium]